MNRIAPFYRALVSLYCVFGLLVGGQIPAFAQSTETDPTAQSATEQVEPAAESTSEKEVLSVEEALDAAKKADQDLLDAIKAEARAKGENTETSDVPDAAAETEGKLEILKDPESMMEMGAHCSINWCHG